MPPRINGMIKDENTAAGPVMAVKKNQTEPKMRKNILINQP